MGRFNLEEYITVESRIEEFWQKYPHGRILTEVWALDPPETVKRMVVMKATIYLDATSQPATTGWAKEREGTLGANLTAFLENAETSAIGRALANLGIATMKGRVSRQEMQAVEANLNEHEAMLNEIKELATIGGEDLQKKVKSKWKLLKDNRIETAKFLEEVRQGVGEQFE